jgi:hypothetical protein
MPDARGKPDPEQGEEGRENLSFVRREGVPCGDLRRDEPAYFVVEGLEQRLEVSEPFELCVMHLVEVTTRAARLDRRELEHTRRRAVDPHEGRAFAALVRVDEALDVESRQEPAHGSRVRQKTMTLSAASDSAVSS